MNPDDILKALRAADAAGDSEGARRLAGMYKNAQQQNLISPSVAGNLAPSAQVAAKKAGVIPEELTYESLVAQGLPVDVPTPHGFAVDEARVKANEAKQSSIESEKSGSQVAGEIAIGGLEAAAAIGTGATTGVLGQVAGTVAGFAKELYDKAAKGEPWNDEDIQKMAASFRDAGTYSPKTERGQEYTQAVGETLAPLESMGPVFASEMGGVGRGHSSVKQSNQTVSGKAGAAASAKGYGVDLMTTDVIPPKTFIGKSSQAIMERIPIAGTAGMRVKQQGQRVDAIKDLFNQYGGGELTRAGDDVMTSLIKKYGDTVTKYVNQKVDVINKLDGQPLDSAPISKAIDDAVLNLDEVNVSDTLTPIINKLEDYKEAFSNQPLSVVEKLRKQLGEELSDPSLASSKSVSEKQLTQIYKAVNETMGDFIKNNGDRRDFTKWQVANKRLAEGMKETKKTALRNILDKGAITPELVDRFLFSKKRSEIELLNKNLSKEGKSNARIAIIQRVADDVIKDDYISPELFIRKMSQHDKSIDVFFKGAEKTKLKGLVEALNMTRRASDAALNAPTGDRMSPFILGGAASAAVGLPAAIGITGGIGLVGRAYESKSVRNSLIALGGAKTASKKEIAYRVYLEALKSTEYGILAGQQQEDE